MVIPLPLRMDILMLYHTCTLMLLCQEKGAFTVCPDWGKQLVDLCSNEASIENEQLYKHGSFSNYITPGLKGLGPSKN